MARSLNRHEETQADHLIRQTNQTAATRKVISLTSAAGIISLLHDQSPQLQEFAIRKLSEIADDFWFEIAGSIPLIKQCSKRKDFTEQGQASLLISKLYYHLGSHDSALKHAVDAGDLLFTCSNRQYLKTITNKCIEYYCNSRKVECNFIDPNIEFIVEKAFHRCLDIGEYSNAIGFALETKRLDLLKRAILGSNNPSSLLDHTFKVTTNLFQNQSFQTSVLELLVEIYGILKKPNFTCFCNCLLRLNDHRGISEMLGVLIKGNEENMLLAYQIAFDLYENADRKILWKIRRYIKGIIHEFDCKGTVFDARVTLLFSILCGDVTSELYLHFLIRYNHTDNTILETTRQNCHDKICYTAVFFANSLMNCGTTSDRFIMDHIEWCCQETNWAAFSATAGLGVINKGYDVNSVKTISKYFSNKPQLETAYTKGGCLYGLGLIHASRGEMIIDYLLDQLKEAKSPEVIHGCCLGVGLAALGTERKDIYDLLRNKLHQDDAIIGESVGIAMGLLFMGSNYGDAIEEMVTYACETRHEKIITGLAIGIALTTYGQKEECEVFVAAFQREFDPFLRCAAMHILAMAYAGTGNNKVVQRLLSVAVNDNNDGVKRAAVQAIGFIFLHEPEKCVSSVALLTDSFNNQTRYGAALALGISCAGSGNGEALSLMRNLTDDLDDLVCQGALIASALILIQQTSNCSSEAEEFRDLYQDFIDDILEAEIVKFGAIIAQGIIDSGGGNLTVSLKSRCGYMNMTAVAGMLIFTQYWYWFPLIHFLSLTFLPTCLIGVNSKMRMPQMHFVSSSRPSSFKHSPRKKRKTEKLEDCANSELAFADITGKEVLKEGRTGSTKESGILSNPAIVPMHQLRNIRIPKESRYEAVKDICDGGIIVMRDKETERSEEFVTSVLVGAQDDDCTTTPPL